MNYFWPSINNTHEANRACGAASGVSFFIAIVTAVIAWLQGTGKINIFPGIGIMAFIDAGLFFCVGIGLCFHSRIAAVLGLVLYFVERVFMIKSYGMNAGQIVSLLIFGVAFLNGVRGAFAWHECRKAELAEAGDGLPAAPASETVTSKPKMSLLRPIIFLLILIAAGFGAAYYLKSNKEASKLYEGVNQKVGSAIRSVSPKLPSLSKSGPKGEYLKLTLKSGRQFEGALVKKNIEGYWFFIEGTGEVFFSSEEIAEVK